MVPTKASSIEKIYSRSQMYETFDEYKARFDEILK